MGWLGLIISIIIIGLIAGAIARLVIPGKQDMSIGMTILLGIVGSFVGGFLGFLIFRADPNGGFLQPAGIIGSIIGAIIVLLIWVAVNRRNGAARRVCPALRPSVRRSHGWGRRTSSFDRACVDLVRARTHERRGLRGESAARGTAQLLFLPFDTAPVFSVPAELSRLSS